MKHLSKFNVLLIHICMLLPVVSYPTLYNKSFIYGEIAGSWFVLAACWLILFAQTIKKKILFHVGNIIGIIGFIISFYLITTGNNGFQKFAFERYSTHLDYQFELGFYVLIVCFILLIINYIKGLKLIDEELAKKAKKDGKPVNIPNNIPNNTYILANYVIGLQVKNIYNNLTIIALDEEKNKLNIVIEAEPQIQKEIFLADITNIEMKKTLITNNNLKKNTADRDYNLGLAATYLFGLAGSMLDTTGFFDDINNYDKIDYKKRYDITINYNENKEEKKLVIYSKIDPTDFINKTKEKINNK